MILQPIRRPIGPLKCLLRQTRQQRVFLNRSMATETTPSSSTDSGASSIPPPPAPPSSTNTLTKPTHKFHSIPSKNPLKPIRTAFAVYPPPPSARETNPAALASYHAQQIRRLDRTGARTALFSKKNRDSARPGDVLQVTTSRGEPFAGVCLSIRRAGVDSAILLRNHLLKTGTEMWFKIYSPSVVGIEIIWRRPKRARRARLTYMRQPKHDMGNIDHLVDAWKRTRNVFSSKAGKGKSTGRISKKLSKR
ncbi:translation protein SH3-like domain-containing protein [Xylariales sp. PMI_506]|nr:translation protein SH3-like domain-containing protein [Xylariales sp. PMI_506]